MGDPSTTNITGKLQTLIDVISRVFAQLHVSISSNALEDLAVTVHRAMTGKSRLYHSLDHALGFLDPDNPIQTIAALYHDIVYYHVDMGYQPEIERVISPYILSDGDGILLASCVTPEDRIFHLTLDAFGFQLGQALNPDHGLNEFLSALFMNIKLQNFVDEVNLLRMTLCIEATIPFRPADYFYQLEDRVTAMNRNFGLSLTHQEISAMIKTAVNFANVDVENFADADVTVLLNDTWKLLPELNIALRQGIYTVKEYSLALHKMKAFMCGLHPELIFHQYHDTPSQEVYERMLSRAGENLATAQEYLEIKLLTAAVLEALAEISGGDAPLSLFLGDLLPYPKDAARRIEDFLPEPKVTLFFAGSSKLFHLLDENHASLPDLDLRNAPLSMFVYQSLDPSIAEERIEAAQRFIAGELSATEFLLGCKGSAITAIAGAIAAMVPTRREKLLEFINIYKPNEIS